MPYPVEAFCSVCNEQTMRNRVRWTDWNSLRHSAQKHMIENHAGEGYKFSDMVDQALLMAREAMKAGSQEQFIPGDLAPSFTIKRKQGVIPWAEAKS